MSAPDHTKYQWPVFDKHEESAFDLASIDRTRLRIWLIRCRDMAPKDLHTADQSGVRDRIMAQICDDIAALALEELKTLELDMTLF